MTLNTQPRPFLADIEQLRRRAQHDMEKGAVTDAYGLNIQEAVNVLNSVLASEIVCVLRYKSHFYQAKGIHAEAVAAEFLQHANEEQMHADRVALRITELNGDPNLNPDGMIARSAAQYGSGGGSLVEMIREDLVAERVVIMWYMEIVKWFGEHDPTSRRMMEDLLAQEETHAQDLADLLTNIDSPPLSKPSGGEQNVVQGIGGKQGPVPTRDTGPNGISDGLDGR